jgi:hypothetical protein
MIVVRIGKSGELLHAKRVIVPGIPTLPGVDLLAGDGSVPKSLLIVEEEAHRTVIDRASLAGGRPTVTRLISLEPVLPTAFDVRGDHLFYIVGHGPTALWLARLGRGHLIGAHRLLGNPGGPVAW